MNKFDDGTRVAEECLPTGKGPNRSDVLRSVRSGSKPETADKNKKTNK